MACRPFGGSRDGATLLVASEADPASMTMAEAVLQYEPFQWEPLGSGCWTSHALFRDGGHGGVGGRTSQVHLWVRPERMLEMDGVDAQWAAGAAAQTSGASAPLRDILFMSKHAAASERPSLTVHPIGNPRRDLEPYGGVAGRLPPPSPRIASLLRAVGSVKKGEGFGELTNFEVTLEATHHGPFLETPSLFAEIGSTDQEWGRKDAGRCWAEALWAELSRTSSFPGDASPARVDSPVVLALGGNHYMCHMNDIVEQHPDVHIGHMLATYVLQDAGPDRIREAVHEALLSTAQSQPEARELFVLVLKKKLRSADRKAVLEALDECTSTWTGPELRVVGSLSELGEQLQTRGEIGN